MTSLSETRNYQVNKNTVVEVLRSIADAIERNDAVIYGHSYTGAISGNNSFFVNDLTVKFAFTNIIAGVAQQAEASASNTE